jgi:hypothetical protein
MAFGNHRRTNRVAANFICIEGMAQDLSGVMPMRPGGEI